MAPPASAPVAAAVDVAEEPLPGQAPAAEEPPLPYLPPAAWLDIIRVLCLRERFLAATVCSEWRGLSLAALSPSLHVVLLNDGAAFGFGRWLRRHGTSLRELTIQEPDNSANGVRVDQFVGRVENMTRLSYAGRLALWHGLAAGGRPLEQLESLTLLMDEVDVADAVAIGMINMPRLTALDFASNASIGFKGAAGLTPLTTLRTLMLPTQAIGDEGLKTIGNSLTGLRTISLHNDGHVSDEGLVHLQGLTALTSLDLQGNVSITGAALSNIAAGLPHLLILNLAHCSLVDDAGLGHLSDLQSLQVLNLHRTRVQCESRSAVAALRRLTALTNLDLSESHVTVEGIANLATSLRSVHTLNLQAADSIDSADDLAPLRQLAPLRALVVSEGRAACMHALPQLTQLTRLAADFMLPPDRAFSPGRRLTPPAPSSRRRSPSWQPSTRLAPQQVVPHQRRLPSRLLRQQRQARGAWTRTPGCACWCSCPRSSRGSTRSALPATCTRRTPPAAS